MSRLARQLLIPCCWLILHPAGEVRGQGDDSHDLLPGSIGSRDDFDERLKARIGRAKDFGNIRDLANRILNDRENFPIEDLQELIKKNRGDLTLPNSPDFNPNDPKWKELFNKAKERFTEEEIESMRRVVGDLDAPTGRPDERPVPGPGEKPPTTPEGPGERPEQPISPPEMTQPSQRGPSAGADPNTPGGTSPEQSESWIEEQMTEMGSWFEGQGEEWATRIEEMFQGSGWDFTDDLGKKLSGILPDLSGVENRLGGMTENLAEWLPRFDGGGSDGPDMPSLGAPEMPGAGGIGGALLILVLIGGGVLLALVFFAGTKTLMERQRARESAWSPGSWPVKPGSVATQEDLIRAFEHLAMLALGHPATTTNHRDLALQLACLPGDPFERHEAANHLSKLYEQARYAPPQEALTAQEVRGARRDLTLLAGGMA